ncbi:hypothetical protein M404DRAFT_293312 [Pisolithus tinctorius Marx 270]|uniref:Uncharacterized protein n=1 Tax=Pisolithus tinctorius Marx 270 TaxID=870435 RepID=A0A0C3NKW0_PISTI|nr:hypothetical protein M404DRAFT_293312 [Pisolithus tinctorius Marx 270]
MTPLTSYEHQPNKVGVDMSACIHHHLHDSTHSLLTQSNRVGVNMSACIHHSAMTALTNYKPQSNKVRVKMSASTIIYHDFTHFL